MSNSTGSFFSAFLALVLLVVLTAPLSSEAGDGSASVSVNANALSPTETIESDRAGEHAPFIKPDVTQSVIAERGFDDADTSLSRSPRSTRHSLTERPETQTPTQAPETRRAILRVYRL